MFCKHCHYEFYVPGETLGTKVRCPNCTSALNVENKQLLCNCPECGGMLDVALWMIGSASSCPHCGKEIVLSLGDDSIKYFPGSEGDSELLKTASKSAGDIIGKYKVIRCLGVGGMGEVYLVEHTLLNTRCALKLLKKEVAQDDPEMRKRLLREARLASQIQHPNLITVLDAELEESSSYYYIVMEYVDGVSIENILAAGPIQENRALEIIADVASALKAASDHKIIHRDIKPANIMLSRTGDVKLADLGIAKVESDSKHNMTLTMDNAVLGTPNYASPEQLRSSHQVDCRADIYSLGVTLFHMLTGKRPFESDSVFGVMANVLEKTLPSAHEVNPEISVQTSALIIRMTAKNRDDRHGDFDELLRDLKSVIKQAGTTGKSPEKTAKKTAENKKTAGYFVKELIKAVIGIALISLLFVGVKSYVQDARDADEAKKNVQRRPVRRRAVRYPSRPSPAEQQHNRSTHFILSGDGNLLQKWLNKESETAVIPAGVTKINRNALAHLDKLKQVVVPHGVTEIGYHAFYKCSNLESVNLPDTLTKIAHYAFAECTNLSVTIPENVSYIGYRALSGVKSVKLDPDNTHFKYDPQGMLLSGNRIIHVDTDVTTLKIPASVTGFDPGACQNCRNLKRIELPESLKSRIGRLNLPENVEVVTAGTAPAVEKKAVAENSAVEKPVAAPARVLTTSSRKDFKLSSDGKKLLEFTNENVEKAIVPAGVESIEKFAFRHGKKLVEVVLPEGLKQINASAFYNLENLEKINIPEGVYVIRRFAFSGCRELNIALPASLKSIGMGAFRRVNSVSVAGKNPYFKTDAHGALFNASGTTLLFVPKSVREYEVPEGVTWLQYGCCSGNTKLERIKLASTVKRISAFSFYNCISLTELTLPAAADRIGDSILSGCTGLKKLTIPPHLKAAAEKGRWNVPKGCKIIISAAGSSVRRTSDSTSSAVSRSTSSSNGSKTVGDFELSADGTVLKKCLNRNIENAVIPSGVVEIGRYAFHQCRNLKSVVIPHGVTAIRYSAFVHCYNLESVTLPESLTIIDNSAFYGTRKLKLVLPAGVKYIGSGAFYDVAEIKLAPGRHNLKIDSKGVLMSRDGTKLYRALQPLKNYTVPAGVQIINGHAFYGQRDLRSVTLPSSVIEIGSGAFCICRNLTRLNIPDNVTEIGDFAFSGCSKLSLTIPASVRKIGNGAFRSVREVRLDPGNRAYRRDSYGAIVSSDNTKLLHVPENIRSYVIPTGVSTIRQSVFSGNKNLTSVTIPSTVTHISQFAFSDCTSLKLTIPASVKSINYKAFSGVRSVKLDPANTNYKYDPQGMLLSHNGTRLLYVNADVTTLRIPEGVKNIEYGLFRDCRKLRTLYLPPELMQNRGRLGAVPRDVKILPLR